MCPIAPFAEVGRNVNERLEAVVLDAAVIGNGELSPPSEQVGAATPVALLPLPTLIGDLRTELYLWPADVANRLNEAMGIHERYPDDHAEFLKLCHATAQTRPTPLLLQYEPGDFNCLHQDLYSERVF